MGFYGFIILLQITKTEFVNNLHALHKLSLDWRMALLAANLRHVGGIIGGCNLVGFCATAFLETHKITDLVGVGSFACATLSLSHRSGLFQLSNLHQIGNLRLYTINGLVTLWGIRLSTYLFNRVLQVGEDKRLKPFFRERDESFLDQQKSFFPLKLASFWSIQAMWGFICMLPVTILNSVPAVKVSSKLWTVLLPSSLGAAGFVIECLADYQKNKYRSDPKNDSHWCDTGLWKYSRHPNCKY